MESVANLEALQWQVQQLEAENADLKNQVAVLQQIHQPLQASLVRSHSPVDLSLPGTESQFKAFMAHVPAIAWLTDAHGVMGYANPAWLAFVGIAAQQAIGQTLESLFPAELAQDYRQNNQWVLDHRAVLETTEQGLMPDGTTRTYLVRKFPVYPQGESVPWIGGIGVDITQMKQAEAALHDSEARWQFALEGAGDGLWDWNAQTNEVYFSPQWKMMLGYKEDDIGNSLDEWNSRVHPDDKAQCYADLEQHFSGETPAYQNEHRMRCKDGSYTWILDRGKVVEWDEHGKPLRVIGTHTDISESKQAEIRQQQVESILRQSEATNRAMIKAIPDLLLRVGRDGSCFSYLPPTHETGGDFLPIHRHLSEVLPPDLLRHQLDRIDRAMATGELQVWEQRLEKHGQICHEEVRLVPCSDDECLVIVRDITERKHMVLALEAKINELDRFFSVALDLLCIGDTDGYFHRLNSAWEKTLGYSVQAMEGTRYIDYVHPEDVEATLAALSSLSQQDEIANFVNRYRCRDGSYRWIEWRSVPVGRMIYGAARDITERRQAELELQSTKDQLDLVLQASSEGYWDWNLATSEIYFSPRWKAMLGYADHELDNSFAMWESVIFAEDHSVALQLMDDYNSSRVDQFSVTQRFHHKDGSTVFVFARAIHFKDDQGQVVRMVGSHLDVTAPVEMQAALQTSEMQLSSVLNSSLNGIMAFCSVRDEAGNLVDFEWLVSNPPACQMVGRAADYLIGRRLLDEMPGNKTDGLFDLYVQVVQTGEPLERQFHYNHDGIDTWFEMVAVKLGDGFAVTFRDITSLKLSEQALKEANQNLESHLDELRQRNKEMQLLGEMNDFLQACITIDEAYQALTTLIAPLFPQSSGGIFTFNPAHDRVENVVIWGEAQESALEFSPQACWALRRGRSHSVAPYDRGLRCTHTAIASTHTLCIPLLAQGETLGLFYLSAPKLPQSTQQLARTMAEQVALALANLHLRETLQHQSIRDPLTGLYNRRYLEEALTQEMQRAQRHHNSIGVVMLDIDHFKRVNDTYGHDAGDRVLQAIGQLLRDNVRGSDIACRYGGEEMTLVLPESSLDVTLARAEEIRQAIATLQISYDSHTLNALTASLGVACFPDHGHTGLEVIKAADASLYQAKAQGRNRVVVVAGPVAKVANGLDLSQISDIS